MHMTEFHYSIFPTYEQKDKSVESKMEFLAEYLIFSVGINN